MPQIKRFKGLNNVSDPLRLGLGWLAVANNINITDTGALSKRDGYSLVRAADLHSAYSTQDYTRTYLSTGAGVQNLNGDSIAALTSANQMFWSEINLQVFYNNGVDSGIINADDSLLPLRWTPPAAPVVTTVAGTLTAGAYQVRCTSLLGDGRETGTSDPAEITLTSGQALQISGVAVGTNIYIAPANSDVYQLAGTTVATTFLWNSSPDALGRDLLNAFLDPLPLGADVICAWRGVLYAAQYLPSVAQTVIWYSEPLAFHLFNLNSNFFMVPGRVSMLAAHDDALIVGTTARVYSYAGDKLVQHSEYGVVPGQHHDKDGDGRIYFWTTRGLCTALPFTNVTERQVSVPPGTNAGGCLVFAGGQHRYLVALEHGGEAFNARVDVATLNVTQVYVKDPNASIDITFDWSAYLAAIPSTIASVQWIADAPLTTSLPTNTTLTATVRVSGGVLGTAKNLTCRITTVGGLVDDRSINIEIINL